MLTEIGKFLRKVRIDRSMLLKDMADGIGVSSAYLSAVETGKRQITNDLITRVSQLLGYRPGTADFLSLEAAAVQSRGQVEIATRGLSSKHHEAALAFSRQFDQMDSSDLDRILQVLQSAQDKR